MLKVKRARTVGFVTAAALLMAGIGLALWPTGAVQAQDEEPPPVANLKCEARTDQVRFSWDIPQWSGGETKWYDVAVTLPNGNRFSERRHRDLRSRTYRGKWQPASEARIAVKALYDLPNGDRVTSVASEASCVVPGTPNSAPAVASAIADATIINESGTHQVALTGVFSDADNDDLTITASSSAEAVATASMASDQSALTVEAKSRGTATITVTAADGNGGTVDDVFTVTVKSAPAVASAIADVSGLEVGSTRDVSLTGVFSDADNDALTVTAASSDQAKATVSVAADYASLTVSGVAEGSASVTVTAQDSDGNTVDDAFDVAVNAAQQQPANNPPAVSSAIADATIINESGTHEASLAGVLSDVDNDALTITASSSAETVATVSVASDQSALTVAAKSRGTATITVTAADGKGGTVDDVFTVTVKSTPVVAAAIADVRELAVDARRQVSMSGVFSDADGDAVTVTQASSSDGAKVAVVSAIDGSTAAITAVTVFAKSEGTATITVTAQDADGNTVSDAFAVTVPAAAVQLQQTQSSDATLSALTLSGYTVNGDPIPAFGLRPAFASGTTEYAASAPQFTARVSVTATATNSGATIQVDGQTVASGAPSQQIRLEDNQPKKITVTVTAADGTTQQSYTVAATGHPRADLRDLTLSPGELNPSIFTTAEQDYRAWTPHSVASVRVTATRRHGSETLTVNGQAVTSGQASPAIDLEVGENRITVVATAPDGYTSKSYTITVTRLTEAQSSDATLSAIMVYQATSFQPDSANNVPYEGDPLALTPAVSRTEREYQAEQPEADGIYVAVAVTTNAPGARSIVIDGPKVNLERRDPKDEVVSGEASGPWQMSLGYQLITIRVTSLDGKNTETYRLVIKRGTVDDLKGLSLSSGDGSLTLSWEASDSPTAPTDYMLRWRKAGETAWLNSGFPPGWKTSYALDAGYAGPAEGDRFASLTQGSATLSGLENGVAYEVQARGARGPLNPGTGERQIFVFLRTDWQSLTGTPGAAQTTLTITPSSPTRQYGDADDLGYTVSGLKSGDAATDVLTGALSRAAGEDAGDYAIGMGTLAVASAHAGKYVLPAAPSVTTYTITPRPVTVISGVTVASRAADGTTDAAFDTSAAAGTGVLPAELADFRAGGLVVSGVFPLAVPGTHDVSVTYSLQDHGAFKAANYSLSVTSDTLRGELTAVAACAAGMMLFADGAPAEGGAPVTVTVGLSSPAGVGGASATLTASGTATGDDYTLSSTTVAIAEGATAGAATITVIDDAVDDDDETIVLNAALSGSNLTAGPLTLTIVDNDAPATPAPTPVAAAGCAEPAGGDYDADDDGLIEVSCLAQLNAIRWDVDGDGSATDAGYAAAFSNAATGMGCPQTGCIGYELTADLDFDTNNNGVADAVDAYWNSGEGWTPIGFGAGIVRSVPVPPFGAVFDGNGHTISNLSIKLHTVISTTSISHGYIGLFSYASSDAVIRNVGLESVDVSPTGRGALGIGGLVGINEGTISNSHVTGVVSAYFNNVGGLAGYNKGAISASYATASVTAGAHTGGLVGWNYGGIYASYATGSVSGSGMVGGLVGNQMSGGATVLHSGGTTGEIVASYATGNVSGYNTVGGLAGNAAGTITASYSLGAVSASYDGSVPSVERRLGGLVGNCVYSCPSSDGDSYWNAPASGQASSPHGAGKTTVELQTPTGYAGIYANWNVDLDGDGSADDPWDFGKSCQYPVLKYGGLNPDDQRAPQSCAAAEPLPGPRVNLVATLDTKAAGYDDAVLRSMSLPQGVTIDPAFQSGVHSYRLTVANDVDRLTFAGRFDPMKTPGSDEAWSLLVVVPGDLTQYELFQSKHRYSYGAGAPSDKEKEHYINYINRAIVANLQRTTGVHTIALPPDAATVIKVAVYKTRIGDHPLGFVPADAETQARKTVYTLTVTRGDPSAGDSSGGAEQSAPTVASAIADLTGLEAGATRDVSLSGVFSDADGDSLTVTAASSDEAKVTVTVAADYSKLTVTGVAVGTATITVTAADADGNRVSDTFDAPVARKYNALIAQMYEWRNDPQWVSEKAHTDRWDRALLAFGETVADGSLTAMTASEAQQFADRGWERWAPVAEALAEIEAGGSG